MQNIDPDKEYYVSDIVKNGWLLTERKTSKARSILRLIELGRLPARAVTIGNRIKVFMVLGADIIEYKNTHKEGKRYKKVNGVLVQPQASFG